MVNISKFNKNNLKYVVIEKYLAWKGTNIFRFARDIYVLGRGPKQKNGKILTELSFFAVFNHKNDLEKVWKSRNEFKLVGFKVEKNGTCTSEK